MNTEINSTLKILTIKCQCGKIVRIDDDVRTSDHVYFEELHYSGCEECEKKEGFTIIKREIQHYNEDGEKLENMGLSKYEYPELCEVD